MIIQAETQETQETQGGGVLIIWNAGEGIGSALNRLLRAGQGFLDGSTP